MQTETAVQQHTRLELARIGALPMRNNVGACTDETGRFIRYGLMNESKQQNEQFKSADIVAPVPIVIQPRHVGRTIAAFGVFETKRADWHMTPGDKRAQAQKRFIDLVLSVGGLGGFVTHPDQVRAYVEAFNLTPGR